MDTDDLQQQLDYEIAFQAVNQLTELGNAALEQGLIVGHGYHGSQYELLRNGEALLFSPEEATIYLKDLLGLDA